jgi:NAD(P)H-dependent flavin oxidoreductase YrpB (nitropropane dioxygenase family)
MQYIKTDLGNQAFKARSPLLSARQRPAFLLFDGKKTVEQVLHATASLGMTQNDVDYLVELDFLAAADGVFAATAPVPIPDMAKLPTPVVATPSSPAAASPVVQVSPTSDQQRYADALPVATQIVDGLGMSGYLLSQAVESATNFLQLAALLPKIQSAAGPKATRELERILKG